MESLVFLTEKRDGTVKARACANGSTQRSYTNKEETASPTAATESILITGVIEAKQKRDVITLDIPNAFVQTPLPQKLEKVIMKIRGVLVDMMIELFPGVYNNFVTIERGQKVLYVRMIKALYGMLVSSMLFYQKFRKDIETIGFKINPYDRCVANRIVNGKQHTVSWHVDDVKSSHINPKVNNEFYNWCEKLYGSNLNGHVKIERGKRHDYLGMVLDYNKTGCLQVDMSYYIKGMIAEFPHNIKSTKTKPWNDKLYKNDITSKQLDEDRRATFHTFVMKTLFLTKRGRPDINTAIGYLGTRVKEPNELDWKKLLKLLGFLKGSVKDILTLEADDTQTLYWYSDAAFAVHPDMRSHTGAVFTLGKGAIYSASTKQKVDARSSTESELVAVDDMISKVMWKNDLLRHKVLK